ncbi:MAG: DNA primase [Bacteroidaceae bacterium]|nr:DNA primase [Bacteroidaceae bacterium]
MIDQATIDRIMDAAQIVDVVSEFVTLRRRGVNYVGLCPFHNEKTPSFSVSPSKGVCKCFSCGKGGNVVHFIMEHEQLNYYEALKWLAKKYGIEVKERELSNEEKQAQSVRESLFLVNDFANKYFQDILHHHRDGQAIGMSYFRQRGFRDDIIKKFQLGFSTESRDALYQEAKKKGFNTEYLVKTGLCYTRDDGQLRDRFWGRVMFPVHTLSGKVVAFGGRVLKTDAKVAKYVNSPESEIYHKSRELYGIYFAKQAIVKQDKCFLVEGYTDVISMHQAGVENVVASSGTALTSGQIRMIHRFTNNVTVLYDGDWAGIKASLRGIDMLLEEGMNIKVMLLPDGEDPDSFARKHNATEFQEYIAAHEVDFIRFKTNLLMSEASGDPFKRSKVIKDIVDSIAVIPEAIVRAEYIKECSQMLQIEERILVSEVAKIKRAKEEKKTSGVATTTENEPKEPTSPDITTNPAGGQPTGELGQGMPNVAEPPSTEDEAYYAALEAGHATATPTNPGAEAPVTPSWGDGGEAFSPLYPKERLIAQQLIRHGEKVMFIDEETHQPVTVTEFVASEFDMDKIAFTTPLFAEVLDELRAHASEPDFVAERYFIAHHNPALSRLAVDLIEEKYQLSKYHSKTQTVLSEVDRLAEIVMHLMDDYKNSLVEQQIKDALNQLRQPEVMSDPDKCLEVMSRYKGLIELKQYMAKRLGDRVISN